MLESIRRLQGHTNFITGEPQRQDARPVIVKLERSMRRETVKALSELKDRTTGPNSARDLHAVIDHLTNSVIEVRQVSDNKRPIGPEKALRFIDTEIAKASKMITSGFVSGAGYAQDVALNTLNLLFAAKQNIKQEFGIITEPVDTDVSTERPTDAPKFPDRQTMVLTSSMLFQIRQSLFPPERMIVGAARRTGENIRIEALFDVTGEASSVGVKADPERLGRALIAMAESGTYFGLWVHSHPGSGSGATHPSSIDITQHADWLRDYSSDLVSAIVVSDRYIRFWGTAVESGMVAISIEGNGIRTVSADEGIYRLAC